MLTIGEDDYDGEMKWNNENSKKLLRVLSPILIYIKSYMDCGCGY